MIKMAIIEEGRWGPSATEKLNMRPQTILEFDRLQEYMAKVIGNVGDGISVVLSPLHMLCLESECFLNDPVVTLETP